MKHSRNHGLFTVFSILLVFSFLAAASESGAENYFLNDIQKRIERRIRAEDGKQSFVCHTELVCGIALVPAFYSKRGFMPAWIERESLGPLVDQLVAAIQAAGTEGLNPAAYHLAVIKKVMSSIRWDSRLDPMDRNSLFADLDILLTDAFLLYGSHLLSGRVNPETIHTDWIVRAHQTDLMHSIDRALNSKQIKEALAQLKPPHFDYTGLRGQLKAYREIAKRGGWPAIPPGPSLRPGDRHKRVAAVRRRLMITGDIGPASGPPDLLDEALVEAVQRFQRRHGLKPDGIAGRKTIQVMNVPADERVRQIELNMERWRWIPHQLGKRYVYVNTADFSLTLVENQNKRLKMRVVVGKPFRQTPVFSADMTYLVINPYWNIPTKIAVEDILPAIQRDAAFLEKKKISVLADWSKNAPQLSADLIDWQAVDSDFFPYKLRQDPGPKNALGRIKFMFPNKFAVYIHDTPQRALFNETLRGFSSGCIRAERPVLLASHLMEQPNGGTSDRLAEALKNGERTFIRLQDPIPVHLLYLTAWIDEQGRMQFRRDIYDRDPPLDAALKEKVPRATLFSTALPSSPAGDDS